MLRLTFILLSIFCIDLSYSQILKGKVLDAQTKKPASFAVVSISNSNKGITCDIDGNFELPVNENDLAINIQLIGYENKTVQLKELDLSRPQNIFIKSSSVNLFEITVTAKENPANAIIRKVIAKKAKFDIDNLKFYSCKTYAKTYFTLADKNGNENLKLKDTGDNKKMERWLDRSYLFFIESVSEKKFIHPNTRQEKILSSRVSGFKSAPFGAFATQLASFTFYKDNIELIGIKYVSPLIPGTFKRYNFEIADTVVSGKDTTVLIRFFPKSNAKFKGMKGMLYINKAQFVLANVLAEPAEVEKGGTGIKVQQLYEKVDSIHWFPKQANTELFFNNSQSGSTDNFLVVKGVSRVYISDVSLDSSLKIRHKDIIVFNEKDFDRKDENFWKQFRKDSLSQKERSTYEVIDSVSRKNKVEEKMKVYTALFSGKWPLGYFDIDLKHIMRINDYEGIRLGVGLSTSNKISRWFSIGGYGGYGIKDKTFKYGGSLKIYASQRQRSHLLIEAASEVMESAGTWFYSDNANFFSTQKVRDFLISRMDRVNYGKGSLNFVFPAGLKTCAYLQVQQRNSDFGFYSNPEDISKPDVKTFIQNEAGIQLRYWPGEKFIESMNQLVTAGSKWPVFFLNVSKGLTQQIDVYKGEFDYTKVDLKIDHQWNFKVKGFLSYQLQAGKVFGKVPYSFQYNNKGSRSSNYYLSAEKTFETMYVNEFISTEYAALFVALNFGRIVKNNKHINPELEIAHNYGIGNLLNREQLSFIELNDISKGYSEAGIRIKNLYRSNFSTFGLAVFYRYGNYAFEKAEQNLTYKLAFGYAF